MLQRAADSAARPFDLTEGPLLRVNLYRLGETEHVLLVVTHHIISDIWSLGLFIRELATLYEARVEQRPSPLPEPPIQFADWAAWQSESLDGEKLAGLYPSHGKYVRAVKKSLKRAVRGGFILKPDAKVIRQSAIDSDIGR